MYNAKKWVVGLVILLTSFAAHAQVSITTLQSPATLVACGETGQYEIYLSESTGSTFPGGTLTLQLPSGMLYQAGSVTGATEVGAGSLEFIVLPNASTPFQTVTFEAAIDCSFDNSQPIQYIYSTGGNVSTAAEPPLANYFFPEVVAVQVDNQFMALSPGQSGVRDYTIIQARDGASVDSLFVVSNYDPALQTATYNIGTLVGSGPTGDTLLLTGNDFPGGDGTFDYDETLQLLETNQLLTCTESPLQLELFWRCNGELCQSFFTNGLTSLANGAPSIRITNQNGFTEQNQANDAEQVGGGFCEVLILEYLVENTGVESVFGAGAAYNLTVAFGLNNNLYSSPLPADLALFPTWSFNARMNGANLPLSPYQHPVADPMLGYNIRFTGLTTDPDGPGGLEDLDGDGFFDDLPVGASTTIQIEVVYDASQAEDCKFISGFPNTGGAQTSFRIGYRHENQCNNVTSYWYGVTDPGINILELFVHRQGAYSLSLDEENLLPDSTSYMTLIPGGEWSSPCGATDSFVLQLLLPEGIMLGDGPSLGPGTHYGLVEVSGDTLRFASSRRGSLNAPWHIPLAADCNSMVFDSTLEISMLYFCSADCPDFVQIDCKELILDYLPQCEECPDGVATRQFDLDRRSLGWQDVYHTQRVDPASNPNVNLRAGLNYDSVEVTLAGVFRGSGPFDGLMARISYNPIEYLFVQDDQPHFEPLEGTLRYFPASGGEVVCPLNAWASQYDADNNQHTLEADLEALFAPGGCLEAITRSEGDSVIVSLMTLVTDNNPILAQPVPELVGGFYRVVNGQETFCNRYLERFMLEEVVPKVHVSYGVQLHFGCDEIFFTGSFINNHGHQADGDQFPDEIRALSYVDETRILLEGHWLYTPGSSTILAAGSQDELNAPSALAPGVTESIPDPVISFDGTYTVLTYTNPGDWPAGDLAINGSNSQQNIRFRATPTCTVPDGQIEVGMQADFTKFTHAPAAQQQTVTETSISTAKSYERQRARITLTSPQIANPIEDTVRWAFLLENITSYAGADKTLYNNWIAVEAGPEVMVIALQDNSIPNAPVTYFPQIYGGGSKYWFQIGDVAAFGTRPLEVLALTQACDLEEAVIYHSFSCLDYPADPDAGYPFPGQSYFCALDSLEVGVRPGDISLALEINDPPIPIPLCEPLAFSIDVSNLQLAYAYDLTSRMTLPEGMELVPGSGFVEYPINSGNMIPLSDPLPAGGGLWVWDIDGNIPLIKGINREPENGYRLHFELETTCDFLGGRRVAFQVSGQSSCGAVSQRQAFSLPLQLQGVPPIINEYRLGLSFPDGGLLPCTPSDIQFSLTNLGPFPTSGVEFLGLLVPAALDYQMGSIVGIHNAPATITDNNLLGDNRLLTFPMPPGVAAGDSIVFSLTVNNEGEAPWPCDSIVVEALSLLSANLPCSSAPGGNCEVYSISQSEVYNLTDISLPLSLEVLSWNSVPVGTTGEQISGWVEIQNNSAYDIFNDSIQLTVYYDANGNGVVDVPQETALVVSTIDLPFLAAGGSLLDSLNFFSPSDQIANLLLTIDDPGQDCACTTLYLPAPVPRLLNAGDDQIVCSGETVTLGIDERGLPVTFQWAALGGAPISALANPTQGITDATFLNSTNNPFTYEYELTTTRPGGFASADTVAITVRPGLSLNLTAVNFNGVNVSCAGEMDGSITANVINGLPPLSYQLNGGTPQDTANFTGLGAGNYTVEVVDGEGCAQTNTITLAEPAPLTLAFAVTQVGCGGDDNGSITALPDGGTPGYSYAWGQSGAPDSPGLTGVTAGTYPLTLTDANGCTLVDSATVTSAIPIVATVNTTPATCADTNDGSATATDVSGGVPGYTYNWGNGPAGSQQNNLAPGDYSLLITDADGCTFSVPFTIDSPPAIEVLSSQTDSVRCYGEANGSAGIEIGGGVTPYTYDWGNGFTTATIANISAGTYQVTVTDGNDCVFTGPELVVGQPAQVQVNHVVTDTVACFGGSEASLLALTFNGVEPISYQLNGGPLQATTTFDSLSAGDYVLAAIDANGCGATQNLTLDEPAPISISFTVEPVGCGADASGSVTALPSGGTAPYAFGWAEPGTPDAPTIANLTAGTYALTITDANGCTYADSATVASAIPLDATITTTPASCSDVADGTASVTDISGGTAPYVYNWGNGPGGSQQNNLLPGDYTLLVTDAEDCTFAVPFTVDGPEAIALADSQIDSVRCHGEANGTINIAVTGGTLPYTYDWGGGLSGANIGNLPAATYQVTVTDDNDCTFTGPELTVHQPAAIQLGYLVTDSISCQGAADGGFSILVNNGEAPFAFQLDGGISQPNSSFGGLEAGDYTVLVTDQRGCSQERLVNLEEPSALSVSFATEGIGCGSAASGSITATPGGGMPAYSYDWETVGAPDSPTLNDLTAGTYTLLLTDANGCTLIDSATVTASTPLDATITTTPASCADTADGTATVADIEGGTAPYVYDWGNGPGGTQQNNLLPGDYTLTVTDAADCTYWVDYTITGPSALAVVASQVDSVRCFGADDGSVSITVDGGTAPYAYDWGSGLTGDSIANLAPGIYQATITDANDCVLVGPELMVAEPLEIVLDYVVTDSVSCFGATDGSIALLVANGIAPFSYQIDGGAAQPDPAFGGLGAGLYEAVVTDAQGCTQADEVLLEAPTGLSLSFTIDSVSCGGGSDGAITVSASGGTSPYTYAWDVPGTPITPTIDNLPIGTYALTATDAAGCQIIDSTLLTSALALDVSVAVSPASCHDAMDGSATVTGINGGVAPYSYDWGDGPAEATQDSLAAGGYTVSIADAQGCVFVVPFVVEAPTALNIISTEITPAQCFGSNTGGLSLQVEGGTMPHAYDWGDGLAEASIDSLSAGLYRATVTDANGCILLGPELEVAQPTEIAIALNINDNISCFGGTDGAIEVELTNGVAPFLYTMIGEGTQDTELFTGLGASLYTTEVIDADGCTQSDTLTLTEPALLEVSLAADTVTCSGGGDGQVVASPAGGTAPYQYVWSSGTAPDDPVLDGIAAGTYALTLTDANGCVAVDSTEVVSTAALAVTVSADSTSCAESMDGSATVDDISGGTAPYSYDWGEGPAGPTRDSLAAGAYTLTITDAAGCALQVPFAIQAPASLNLINSQADSAQCFGSSDGSVSLEVAGGTVPYTYSWDNGGIGASVDSLTAGDYQATITDANGCVLPGPVLTVHQPAAIELNTFQTAPVSCFGFADGGLTTVVSNGVSPFTFQLGTEVPQDSANFTGLGAGTYQLLVTDGDGCTQTDTLSLAEPALLEVALTSEAVDCAGNNTGTLSAEAVGGTMPYSYDWAGLDEEGQSTVDSLVAGSYTLILTDANGCLQVDSTTIAEPAAITGAISALDASCAGYADGSAVVDSLSGGVAPYELDWGGGQTGNEVTALAAGAYTLSITDANECLVVLPFAISEPDALLSVVALADTLDCHGDTDGSVSITVDGGTEPYTYNWGSGWTGASVEGLPAGTYQATVTDGNDCVLVGPELAIVQPEVLQLVPLLNKDVSCFGLSDGMATVEATGGSSPYQYWWPNGTDGATATGLPAGSQFVEVEDQNGCLATVELVISSPLALTMELEVRPPDCVGGLGSITALPDVATGTPPYQYTLQEDTLTNLEGYFPDLAGGSYVLLLEDANGCTLEQTATVPDEHPPLIIVMPDQVSTGYQEPLQIQVEVLNATDTVLAVWLPGTGEISCGYCLDPIFTPTNAANYQLQVSDAAGCTAQSTVQVLVDRPHRVYIPNVFSPNGDGQNDVFFLHGSPEAVRLVDLKIMERWGGMVFSASDVPLSTESHGWDGMLRGQPAPPGVYVYVAEVEFEDGVRRVFQGSVTLMR